ncbi:MAG: hypothetical protein ACE5JM_07265, partial [Armatimonadota bacterium]
MRIRLPGVLVAVSLSGAAGWAQEFALIDDFDRPDTLYHGHHWETLNPGYWKIQDNALRRRLQNVGNRNPITSFPFHWSSGGKEIEPRPGDRTPNLPMGMIWRRDWTLTGNYTVRATFTVRDLSPEGRGEQDGYMGVCFGGESLYESRNFRGGRPGAGSWMALWHKDGTFGLYDHASGGKALGEAAPIAGPQLKPGDEVQIEVEVGGDAAAAVTARVRHGSGVETVTVSDVDRALYTDGY